MGMANAEHAEETRSKESGAEILLVEDDPGDAEFALRALQQSGFGHRVAHVKDGIDALDYIGSRGAFARSRPAAAPKLILLDLALKKMSGLHVLRHLKSDERTKGIPVVVLTGSMIAIELAESYKLGVNSYVIKSSDGRKFAGLISEIAHYWLEINQRP